ncbi:Voltage-dependent N-type calcium channel subunit alpha-1B [Talaromyces islandicus]|uniref:Voltage-dependent N-type calcium channel subunit alpha-1B n=1 Tax=Talaromyces islandicus TaxID=28573 RepID=A0A0U1LTT1_TALIS|nr:Voltage-dependent N-type calcium channel subunit alpha-1B [Talaromyces islandicus]
MSFLKRFKTKKTKSKETLPPEGSPPAYPNLGPRATEQIIASSTNSAFQEAWQMHWKELNESEKLAWSFQEVKSPLKVHKTIDDMDKYHRDQSVSRKFADGTLRFLRAIETLMAGVTIGMQAHPDVSSIVVGIVRVVINIAVKYFEYYEKLSEMLERLSDQLHILDLFTRNNSNEPLLHSTLVAIYGSILAFCRYARRAFVGQGNMKRSNSFAMLAKVQWAPFEEQFGRIQSNLKHHTENLDRISAAMTLNSTLAVQEDMKKVSLNDQNERREFLDWISKENIEENHEIIRQKRLENTGSWLFEHGNYKKWAQGEKTGPLWLFGPAGTGKSILASTVIDHFSKNDDSVSVIYIYFKGEDTIMQHSLVDVLSMLMKQLCWNIEVLPEQVLEFYRTSKRNARQPTSDNIKALFTKCLNYVGKTVLVFDGLDEFEQRKRKQLLSFVHEALSEQLNVKVFVTSRFENDIKHALRRCNCLSIDSVSQTRDDLARVVRHQVIKELGHIDPDFQEEVIKLLIEKSGGIFLWVNFQLNDLTQVPEQFIKDQLNLLPSGLEETYLEYFRGINAQPQTAKTLAQRCFLWTFHAKARLTAAQLRDAVSLDLRTPGNEEGRHNTRTMEQVTKSLLTIPEFPFSRVRPIHFSLQEFATNSNNFPSDLRDFLLLDSESANGQLAILCLEHLMADVPPRDGFDTILFYCGRQFTFHIQSLKCIPDGLIDLLDRLFLKEQHKLLKILTWRWPISHDSYPDMNCPGSPQLVDPVFFMKCMGFDKIDALWTRYSNIKRPKCYPDGYLHLAVVARREDLVRDVIAGGVKVDHLDVDGHSALHYSCAEGIPLDIVKVLIEAGADINLRTPDGGSPLKLTKRFNHGKISEFLEEIGAAE